MASLAVVGTGVVTAAASSSSTSYVACASSKHVLSLESHKKCPKGSAKVTIAARGPAGAKGAKGNPGAAGPSKVYNYDYVKNGGSGGASGGTAPPLNGTPSGTLMTLPPGSYLMHFDLGAYNPTSTGWVSCVSIYTSSAPDSPPHNGQTVYADVPATGQYGNHGSGSMTEALSITSATAVSLSCNELINSTMTLEYVDVTATQTGSLVAAGFVPN